MPNYLLSVYQPEGQPPDQAALSAIMTDVHRVNTEMHEAGAWVFSAGLFAPSTATVVRYQGDEQLVTDGPFLEAKEYLGGLTIIRAADLDAALEWGRKLARATTLPIEVRPFADQPGS